MQTDVPLPYDYDCSIDGYTQCISQRINIRFLSKVTIKPYLLFKGEGNYFDMAIIALSGSRYNFKLYKQ